LLGWPSGKTTATDFATYTIDWQPGYVSWYVDGRLLQRYAQGERRSNGNIFRVSLHSGSRVGSACDCENVVGSERSLLTA
jgi:beta-glucanase (GH16 family)